MAYTANQIARIIGTGDSRVIPRNAPLTLSQRVSESEVRRRVYSYEDATAREVLRLFEDAYSDIRDQYFAMAEYGNIEQLSTSEGSTSEWKRLINLYTAARIVQLLSDSANVTLTRMPTAYNAGYWGRAWSADTSTKPDVSISHAQQSFERIRDVFARRWQQTAGMSFAESFEAIAEEYKLKVRKQLNAAVVNGETVTQALKRIQKLLGLDYVSRGKRSLGEAFWFTQSLTRKAIMSASNLGALMLYVENALFGRPDNNGLGSGYRIITAGDGKVCKVCYAASQQIYPMSALMEQGAIGVSAPVPPLHPNCRCSPIFMIFPKYLLPDNEPPRETWREWLSRIGLGGLLGDFMGEDLAQELSHADA